MDFEFETDKWPVMKARFFGDMTQKRPVRVVVIHSMEAPEKGETAENVARYFQNTQRKASAHLCIDSNSIVQCVLDNDVAFAAPGANQDGVHLELAGFAKQTRAEWLDSYSTLMLENTAEAAAQYCLKYTIPIKHLTNDELNAKQKGIVGHIQVSEVYQKSTHTDPGKEFSWDYFIERVSQYYADRRKKMGI